MEKSLFIAIEGPIGVGKTTLARLLQPHFEAKLLLENFEGNPFLGDFYADRRKYAFQTQIFFLLSRYQQHIHLAEPGWLEANVLSDYTFVKDRLFAYLNLSPEELELYEQIHTILAEGIRHPNLIVYLKASLDVLMERIAFRDRPYERNMDRDYIEEVRLAYERFYARYNEVPILALDTDHLNFVRNPEDLNYIVRRVRLALKGEGYQKTLPSLDL